MKDRRSSRFGLSIFVLAVAVAAGIGIGTMLVADVVPDTLKEAEAVVGVPITQRSFDDRRTVELGLTFGADSALNAPVSGRVTALSCQSGATFFSGQSNLAIDGQRIVNLATEVPLWRDLSSGDRGEDVVALQKELSRLGFAVAIDGIMGRETLGAMADVLKRVGASNASSRTVHVFQVLWIPKAEVSIASCAVSTGAFISAGQPIASLSNRLAAAEITILPDNIAVGERVLEIEGQQIAIDGEGRVTDSTALAVIEASAAYAQAIRASMTAITGHYLLAEPVTVSVVLPGALYGIDGQDACVVTDGQPRAVQIIGSELGQSFVTFDAGGAPDTVDLIHEDPPCR